MTSSKKYHTQPPAGMWQPVKWCLVDTTSQVFTYLLSTANDNRRESVWKATDKGVILGV